MFLNNFQKKIMLIYIKQITSIIIILNNVQKK